MEDEQLERVFRHLSAVATVHLKHDKVAHAVSLRISGMMMLDDVRFVEQRVERFAEENARVGAILLCEWNGSTNEIVVGMNWDAQCLLRLGAVQEQLARLSERHFDFLLRLEPPGSPARGKPLMCLSIETDNERLAR